jgi:hemerythrin superfamily protein
MPNGIDLILADHQRVNDLFTDFNTTPSGVTVGLIVDALTAHDDAEHGALYPLALEIIDDNELIGRFDRAHVLIKRILANLRGLEGQPLIDAVTELQVAVSEHVADEEKNLLPQLASAATPAQLDEIGTRILQVKQRL